MAKKEEKSVNKSVHEVDVKIDGDSWKGALDKAFKKAQKNVNVDGFRKGKVPRNIFEKKFGKAALYPDAADFVIDEAFTKALAESKLVPVVRPDVNIKDVSDEGVEFTFKIVTSPEVKVNKYKGLKVKKEEVEVTDEEIDHELGHLLERYTELVVKDGKVENGNVAVIDFEGFKDGVAFDGGKGENYSLEIGSNTFIPGFEEKVIGMKVGEEKDLNLTFPEEYGVKDLAGADVVFKVKVNEIKEKKTPEMNEDFFEDLGMDGVTSEKELREEIKKSITNRKEVDLENQYVDNLFEEVGKNVEVDIPEEMVNEETDRLVDNFKHQLEGQGISLDLYYQITGSKEENIRSEMEKDAFKNVLYRLMIDEIIKLENIEVTDEETDKEIKDICDKYKMTKEEVIKEFGSLEMVKYDLRVKKAVELLKEYNK